MVMIRFAFILCLLWSSMVNASLPPHGTPNYWETRRLNQYTNRTVPRFTLRYLLAFFKGPGPIMGMEFGNQFIRPWRDWAGYGSCIPTLETAGFFRASLAGLQEVVRR